MQNKKIKKLLFISLTILITLTACSNISSIRKSWICISPNNGFDCSYTFFTGQEMDTMRLDEGELLHLSYNVAVESGNLQIKFIDPSDHLLWEVDLTASDSDEIEVVLPESGRYSIIVTGNKAEGNFNITWETSN